MLNENIKNLRVALGLSQEELAESLHVVRQTVSKWEKGLSAPDAELLHLLAKRLNTTVANLIGKTIHPDSTPSILPGMVILPGGAAGAGGMTEPGTFVGAVDIGGTKIQIGLLSGNGEVLGVTGFSTDSRTTAGELAADKISRALVTLCVEAGVEKDALCGIGVFCAGPLDTERGTVENPYTLPGWEGLPLAKLLRERTGLPVKLDNDANGALLGEVYARGLSDKRVLMVTLGTGIGVAFWDRGDLFRSGKYHPEMGHILASDKGPVCYCGQRGCFESLCSGKAVNERANKAGYADFEDLIKHVRTQEDRANELLAEIMRDFRRGIWSLRVVFKPEILILAGGFAKQHFGLLREALNDPGDQLEDFTGIAEILPESDVPNVALLGACILPWKRKKGRKNPNEAV